MFHKIPRPKPDLAIEFTSKPKSELELESYLSDDQLIRVVVARTGDQLAYALVRIFGEKNAQAFYNKNPHYQVRKANGQVTAFMPEGQMVAFVLARSPWSLYPDLVGGIGGGFFTVAAQKTEDHDGKTQVSICPMPVHQGMLKIDFIGAQRHERGLRVDHSRHMLS